MTQISTVHPDFEGLVQELQSRLALKGTWNELLPSSTGETLIELASAIGTFNQFAIEQSFREAFPHTANRDSSIYASTRMLGVRIGRKLPGSYTITIFNQTVDQVGTPIAVSIPAFSQFEAQGELFFNRDTINVPPGGSYNTGSHHWAVYEGEVREKTFISDGSAFQQFYLEEKGFIVADTDVRVIVRDPASGSSETWVATSEPLWLADASQKVYYDNTDPEGDLIITFGDASHGTVPPVGHEVIVRYAATKGSSANISLVPVDVNLVGSSQVTGRSISATFGDDEKPSSYYKMFAPHIHRAKGRAISKRDYQAIILGYPGVADVTIQGQRDVDPGNPAWLNNVRVCVLPTTLDSWGGTNPNPVSSAWTAFLEWLDDKLHSAIQIQTYNPTPVYTTVDVRIGLFPHADAPTVEQQVKTDIKALFDRGPGTLGKNMMLSDIMKAARVEGVDYVIINTPTADIIPSDKLQYVALDPAIPEPVTVQAEYSERTS